MFISDFVIVNKFNQLQLDKNLEDKFNEFVTLQWLILLIKIKIYYLYNQYDRTRILSIKISIDSDTKVWLHAFFNSIKLHLGLINGDLHMIKT